MENDTSSFTLNDTSSFTFLNPYTLNIYDLNGTSHSVTCYGRENTIYYLKFILSNDTKIDPDEILLYYNDKQLMDHKTLGDYGIDKNSIVKMYYKIRTHV